MNSSPVFLFSSTFTFLLLLLSSSTIALNCHRCIYWEGHSQSQGDCQDEGILSSNNTNKYLFNCDTLEYVNSTGLAAGFALTDMTSIGNSNGDQQQAGKANERTVYCGTMRPIVNGKNVILRSCFYDYNDVWTANSCTTFNAPLTIIVNVTASETPIGIIPANNELCLCDANNCTTKASDKSGAGSFSSMSMINYFGFIALAIIFDKF